MLAITPRRRRRGKWEWGRGEVREEGGGGGRRRSHERRTVSCNFLMMMMGCRRPHGSVDAPPAMALQNTSIHCSLSISLSISPSKLKEFYQGRAANIKLYYICCFTFFLLSSTQFTFVLTFPSLVLYFSP